MPEGKTNGSGPEMENNPVVLEPKRQVERRRSSVSCLW